MKRRNVEFYFPPHVWQSIITDKYLNIQRFKLTDLTQDQLIYLLDYIYQRI